MKKILFTILMFCFLLPAFGQSPGGVTGPDLWIKSDDAGNIASAWKDHSSNADDIPSVGVWALSPADRAHNFHPYTTGYTGTKLFFNNNSVLNPTAGIGVLASHSIFTSVRPTSATTSGRIVGIDDDGSAAEPGVSITNGGLPNHYEWYNTTTDTNFSDPYIIGAVNVFSSIADNAIGFGDGSSTSSGGEKRLGLNGTYQSTTFTGGNRFQLAGKQLRVGFSGWTHGGAFPGDIMEVIWYNRMLTPNEQSRVNSYLAMKNGVTLAEDYLAADNKTVWSRTTNTGYNNNIFGIARDNGSALHQKQATSTNPGQKLIIGHSNNLYNSNAENNEDLIDQQFLLVGDNGLKQSLYTPLSKLAPGGEVNYRFESIWKVQNTDSVGEITVAWPKEISNLHLVKSSGDATIDASDTFIPMDTEVTINGIVYYIATVSFNTGDYFTFAGYANAPGGVVNALSYWYRADMNAANTGADTDVTSWTDFFSGTVSSQLGTADLPKYVDGSTDYFNFNPGINFTANSQKIGNISVQTLTSLNFDIFTFTKEGMATGTGGVRHRFFNVGRNNTDMSGTNWDSPGFLIDGNILRRTITGADLTTFNVNPKFSTTIPSLAYHTFTDTNFSRGLNGDANGASSSHSARGQMTGGHIFGANSGNLTAGDDDGFVGHLGETIIYGAGNLSATERRRVDSYLAIKYGITLDRVATDHYLASDEEIVWNGADNIGYNNNIFGIANDKPSALHQKQSKSVNPGQKLILGVGTSLADTNLANANALGEGQYLVVGDNGLKQSLALPLAHTAPGGEVNYRFESVWKPQNTNGTGTVIIAWPKGISNLHLVKSSGDATFDASDNFIPMDTEVTINGVVYNTATVSFINGDYFTFAGFGHAPGGVANALSYWYRADANTTNTGVGMDVTGWTDVWSGTTVSQLGTVALPKYEEGAANYFNFNPGVNFTANNQSLGNYAVQTLTAVNFDIFTFVKEGASAGNQNRIFNVGFDNTTGGGGNWDSPGIAANGFVSRRTNTGGLIGGPWRPGTAPSATVPSITYNTFTNTDFKRAVNGEVNSTTQTHTAIGQTTGGHIFGMNDGSWPLNGDDPGFIGHIGETIVYGSGNLSAEERRRVDSYLAIKYGLTLGRVATDHYLDANAGIVWSGVQNAIYNNNIFGVAREDIGLFHQKVSRSVNAGTILTVATISDFTLPNSDAARTGFASDNTYFLLGDNNVLAPAPVAAVNDYLNGVYYNRIPKVWLALEKNNDAGALYFEVDLSAYTTLGDTTSDVVMLVADNDAFTDAVEVMGTYTAGKWVYNHNVTDGQYITFAKAATSFDCEDSQILYSGGTSAANPVNLNSLEATDNPLVESTLSASALRYQATGFNPVDGFIYGIEVGGTNRMVRVDADGIVTVVGTVTGLPAANSITAGEIDPDGKYYVMGATATNNAIYTIDIETMTATSVTATGITNIGFDDFAYNVNDGLLYGTRMSNTRFAKINPVTGLAEEIGTNTAGGAFPAMFGSSTGEIYGISTNTAAATKGLYKFNLVDGTRVRVAELTTAYAGTNNVDGAHCVTAPIQFDADISVTKTDGQDEYVRGANSVYTIIVRNDGPFAVTNVNVSDDVPAGIPSANVTYTAVVSAGSTTTVAGTQTGDINDTVTLPVNGTVTYSVTVEVPEFFAGDLVNTVVVTPPAYINDLNASNNTATDTNTNSGPLPCTKPGATGDALASSVGILTKGDTSVANWPQSVPNGYLVLDAVEKGMVITHTTPDQITDPIEGMLIYDTAAGCVKLYRGDSPVVHPSRTGWVCIERICID